MKANSIKLNKNDNVITVVCNIAENEEVLYLEDDKVRSIVSKNKIPAWNKMSIKPIPKGENVIKYGEIIGCSMEDINNGEYVSHLNICSLPRDYEFEMK